MYFSTSGLRKTWLDKCLKKPVSGNPLASNMGNGPKHCWNLNGSNFTIFIGKCEGNSVAKSVSLWYAKYSDYFLRHWVHMTISLFFKLTIYCNILRCNYLRKKKVCWFFFCFFFLFFFPFSNFRINLEYFHNKDDPHSWCVFELTHSEIRG